ncbi:MAG: hypothetical protein CL685_02990 [Candidatus Magasanikbacteria bacterium]|nr:hypothetical protein [Candidatus Magasanikbacteria bacterium]|tara:strand:+ start:3096 stop:3527 length:432 start_codon:yes stop_codon:yes gene_type:complete
MKKYLPHSILAICIIAAVSGIYLAGSPSQARAERYDEQRIDDMTYLYNRIIDFYEEHDQTLPDSLSDTAYFQDTTDPETGKEYRYTVIDKKTYSICAHFSTENNMEYLERAPYHNARPVISWKHKKGEVCFEREIPPAILDHK